MFRYCKEGQPPKDIETSKAFTRFMYRLYNPLQESLRSGTMTLMNMLNHSSGCVKLESTPGYVCFWDLQTLPALEDLRLANAPGRHYLDVEAAAGTVVHYNYVTRGGKTTATANGEQMSDSLSPAVWLQHQPDQLALTKALFRGFDLRARIWNRNPVGIIQTPSIVVFNTTDPDEYFLSVHHHHQMRYKLRKNLRIIRTLIAMKAYTSVPNLAFPWVPYGSRVFRKYVERTIGHLPVVSSINDWLN